MRLGLVTEASLWMKDRAKRCEPVALGGEQLKPKLLHTSLDRVAGRLMADANFLEALVQHGAEASVQGHDHGDGCGVVVGRVRRIR